MNLAPVAVFTYKRAQHTASTLESLLGNAEARKSAIYIFSDGPRTAEDAPAVAETRRVIRQFEGPNMTVIFRDKNHGLAASIGDGVTSICREHGRAIVLEDDLVVAPAFLRYMNAALTRYEGEAAVMQVSGHMFPVSLRGEGDGVFLPFITSWGWATWDRAWRHFDPELTGSDDLSRDKKLRRRFDLDGSYPYFRMLRRQVRGEIDSWAIRWYWSVFSRGGMALYPTTSLVRNIGLDGTGTHGHGGRRNETGPFEEAPLEFAFPEPAVNMAALKVVCAHLRSEGRLVKKLARRSGQVIRARLLRLAGRRSP